MTEQQVSDGGSLNLICIDSSKHSQRALECKFPNTWVNRFIWIPFLIICTDTDTTVNPDEKAPELKPQLINLTISGQFMFIELHSFIT